LVVKTSAFPRLEAARISAYIT